MATIGRRRLRRAGLAGQARLQFAAACRDDGKQSPTTLDGTIARMTVRALSRSGSLRRQDGLAEAQTGAAAAKAFTDRLPPLL
jgi:hypothetical protein